MPLDITSSLAHDIFRSRIKGIVRPKMKMNYSPTCPFLFFIFLVLIAHLKHFSMHLFLMCSINKKMCLGLTFVYQPIPRENSFEIQWKY